MSNPYDIPESRIVSENMDKAKSSWILPLSIGLTVISGLVYATIYPIVPLFKEIFEGFDVELSSTTRFVLDTYIFYGFFFLLGLIPCMILSRKDISLKSRKKLFKFVVLNFILAFLALGFVVVAMYLPVFNSGSGI